MRARHTGGHLPPHSSVSSPEAVEISDVTIYGKIIMSADYADNGDDGYLGITSSNSRLGFRGYFT